MSKPGNIMQFYYLMYNSKDFEDIYELYIWI